MLLISADVIPAKRKRKIVTQTQEKPQTFEIHKPANQTISAQAVVEEERKCIAFPSY